MAHCSRPQFDAAFIPRDSSAARELMGHHLVDIFQTQRGHRPSTRDQRRPSETRQMKERPIGAPCARAVVDQVSSLPRDEMVDILETHQNGFTLAGRSEVTRSVMKRRFALLPAV